MPCSAGQEIASISRERGDRPQKSLPLPQICGGARDNCSRLPTSCARLPLRQRAEHGIDAARRGDLRRDPAGFSAGRPASLPRSRGRLRFVTVSLSIHVVNAPAPQHEPDVHPEVDPPAIAAGSTASLRSASTPDAEHSTLLFVDAPYGAAPGSPSAPGFALRMFGRYEMLAEIARGGMGVVYRARDRQLERLVALKVVKAGELADVEQRERFQLEAKAAAQLDHPGIVSVYEAGEFDGQPFMAMALVEGRSLWQQVKESPLPPRLAADTMRQVAEAIQYAHDRGVVHRDLKPQNILVARDGEPKVADFGLAKRQDGDAQLTATGTALGTPSYMPPEQATGKTDQVGPLADVYSLGATLYCLLTGRPPFQAATQLETMRQVVEQEPVSPRALNQAVSVDLETICLRCLEKEPARRYASAQALADDLRRFLGGEPIAARPVGPFERSVKWARRKPVAAALALVSVLGVGALLAAGVSVADQLRLARFNAVLEGQNDELDRARKAADKSREEADRLRGAAEDAKRLLARHRYGSDLAIAGRAWREGDVGRMLEMLERQTPREGDEDLRGFEWYYLRALERHDLWRDDQRYCRLDPTGKILAVKEAVRESGQEASVVRLMDPLRRAPLHEWPGPAGYAAELNFSRDGKRIVVPVDDAEAIVFDVESGRESGRIKVQEGNIAVAFLNADGTLAATGGQGDDHSLRVWDVATGKQLHRWTFPGYAFLVQFSPEGRRIAFATQRNSVSVYDLANDESAFTTPPTKEAIADLDYDASGAWIAAATTDDEVTFFDAATGKVGAPPAKSAGLLGNAISFSADGRWIATAVMRDNSVRLWDAQTGRETSRRRGHRLRPHRVALGRDGELALSWSLDGSARLWRMTGPQEHRERTLPTRIIHRLAVVRDVRNSSPQAETLAGLDESDRFHFVDGTSLQPLEDGSASVWRFAFSADGRTLITATAGGQADVWNVATRRRRIERPLAVPNVVDVALSSSGRHAATYGADRVVRVWNAESGQLLHQFPALSESNGLMTLRFQPGADLLVAPQPLDGLRLFRLGDKPTIETFPDRKFSQVEFDESGRRVATIQGYEIVVSSFPEFEPLARLKGHGARIANVHFHPDGTRMGSVSDDKTIRLWDLATGQELLTLAAESATDFAFSPDGRRIYAASGNQILEWTW